MAILKDCYYESMDPISQMVEPLVSPVLDVAEVLPHKYSIPLLCRSELGSRRF